jgi:hypothetical protein
VEGSTTGAREIESSNDGQSNVSSEVNTYVHNLISVLILLKEPLELPRETRPFFQFKKIFKNIMIVLP